jgi:protein-disulfide isomerase
LLAVAALQSRGRARTLRLQALVLGAIGGAVFSGYMALVSFGVLGTACLMCLGLYTAATAQLGLALMLVGAGDGNTRLFAPSALLAAALAMVVAVGLGGRYLWGAEAKTIDVDHASLAALREQDEKFFDWYLAQPVVEPGKLPGGAKAGTVVIVEFSDFECGYCKRNHSMVSELRARHPGAVSAIHRNFPLDPACNEAVDRMMHPNACRAAEAAECADAQGLYEPMAEVLFDNEERLFESNLGKLAEYAGLDAGLFDECMRTRATLGKIAADSREGKRLEVTSTPTLFINGRRIRGTFDSPEKYELAVAMELRLAAGDEPPAEYRPLANPQ